MVFAGEGESIVACTAVDGTVVSSDVDVEAVSAISAVGVVFFEIERDGVITLQTSSVCTDPGAFRMSFPVVPVRVFATGREDKNVPTIYTVYFSARQPLKATSMAALPS